MKRLKVSAEFSGRTWAAFSDDMPGVYATGKTLQDAVNEFANAVEFHIEGLAERGLDIPAVDWRSLVVYPLVHEEDLGKLRKSLGINQVAMAQKLNSNQSRISLLETNPSSVSFGTVKSYLAVLAKEADLPALALV